MNDGLIWRLVSTRLVCVQSWWVNSIPDIQIDNLGPLCQHGLTLIPEWMNNYIQITSIVMLGMKLIIHTQTPNVYQMTFVNRWVISSHTLLSMLLLIHIGIIDHVSRTGLLYALCAYYIPIVIDYLIRIYLLLLVWPPHYLVMEKQQRPIWRCLQNYKL